MLNNKHNETEVVGAASPDNNCTATDRPVAVESSMNSAVLSLQLIQ